MKPHIYLIAIALALLVLITTYMLIPLKYLRHESTTPPLTTSTPVVTKREFNPFLNISPIYRDLGYPKISKGLINISVYYQYPGSPSFTYGLGYLEVDVLSLDGVIESVAKELGLDSSKYKLVSASLSRGIVVNDEVRERPEWVLNFVRTYRGYWLWGCYSYYSHIEVRVDALNGTIVSLARCDEELPPNGLIPKLNIDMNEALSIVRSLPRLKGELNITVPEGGWEVIRDGEVFWVDLRLAKLGPGARNYYLENVINPKYVGRYGLFWVIALHRDVNYMARRVVALVDAETGDVVSITYASMPITPWSTVFIVPNYTSVEGIEVRDLRLDASPNVLNQLGIDRGVLVIQNVTLLKPGSEGSIGFIIKPVNIDQDLIGNITVENPITTQKLPEGLVFETPTNILIRREGLSKAKLVIKVSPKCQEGIWLLRVWLHAYGLSNEHPCFKSATYLLVCVSKGDPNMVCNIKNQLLSKFS